MSVWHNISKERIKPDDFLAVIEIPKNSKNKYELDKESGMLIMDRVLYTSTHYPSNYGFIPKTYADDDDPLDVLVLCSEVIAPLAMARCYPIGGVLMKDGGVTDYKIIAIPFKDPMWNSFYNITHIPTHIMNEIVHFFNVYKELEHKKTTVVETFDRMRALDVIKEAIDAYAIKFEKIN